MYFEFRAYHKERGYYMGAITNLMLENSPQGIYSIHLLGALGDEMDVPGEELEIEQFTGLVDKNGTKIFENDIIAMDSWNPKHYVIKFIEGAFCLANKEGEFMGDIHYIHHADRPQATVVGNIHKNSNLLKDKV